MMKQFSHMHLYICFVIYMEYIMKIAPLNTSIGSNELVKYNMIVKVSVVIVVEVSLVLFS